jgi:membrane-associated phospholipid phosphatase
MGPGGDRTAAERIARWVSILGHPFVLLPLTVLAIGLRHGPFAHAGRRALLVAALLVLPVLGLLAARVRAGAWTDYDVSDHEQRRGFYWALLAVLPLGSLLAWRLRPELGRGLLAGWALLLASMLANRFLKSSLHVAFAAFCGGMIARTPTTAVPCLALVAGVAWSRVVLRRHTVAEVLFGAALGAGAAAFLLIWR